MRHPSARVAEVAYHFAAAPPANPRRPPGRPALPAPLGQLRLYPAGQPAEERPTNPGRAHRPGSCGSSPSGWSGRAAWSSTPRPCGSSTAQAGWNHLVGASLATQASTAWNFAAGGQPGLPQRAQAPGCGRAVQLLRDEQPPAAGPAAGARTACHRGHRRADGQRGDADHAVPGPVRGERPGDLRFGGPRQRPQPGTHPRRRQGGQRRRGPARHAAIRHRRGSAPGTCPTGTTSPVW